MGTRLRPSLSSRLKVLSDSPMKIIASLLGPAGANVIRLHAGEPSLPPPLELVDQVVDDLRRPESYAYTPVTGLPELREALAEDLRADGIDATPDEVAITSSGTTSIFGVLSAILDPGDEVILTDPTFMMYRPVIEYLGARARWVRSPPEEGFQPDVEAIKEAIGERTKAIVVVDPDNPTGRLMRPEASRALAEVAQDKGVYLLVDEAYRRIVYEGSYQSPQRYAPDNVVGLGSFSKDPGVPGLRVGYVYGPKELVEAYAELNGHMVFGASNASQLFVLRYLRWRGREAFIRSVVEEYRRRRDAAVSAARRHLPSAKFMVPQGSMYLYLDLSPLVSDSERFAAELASRHGVTVMPGTAFGPSGRTFVRVTFVSQQPDRLEEGVRRIGAALS
jgi:aspartate aminotransferase